MKTVNKHPMNIPGLRYIGGGGYVAEKVNRKPLSREDIKRMADNMRSLTDDPDIIAIIDDVERKRIAARELYERMEVGDS